MAEDHLLTVEQAAALDVYWAARTPEDERAAYKRMMDAGFPDRHGYELYKPTTAVVEAKIAAIVQGIIEWDDRTSPADWPEALLITGDELASELRQFARDLGVL